MISMLLSVICTFFQTHPGEPGCAQGRHALAVVGINQSKSVIFPCRLCDGRWRCLSRYFANLPFPENMVAGRFVALCLYFRRPTLSVLAATIFSFYGCAEISLQTVILTQSSAIPLYGSALFIPFSFWRVLVEEQAVHLILDNLIMKKVADQSEHQIIPMTF